MRTQIGISAFSIIIVLALFLPQTLFAGGNGRKSGGDRPAVGAIGVRVGWSGGVSGLSYKHYFSQVHGLEIAFGYNIKEARYSDRPWTKKGNWILSARYQPALMFGCSRWVGFYGSIGASARYHNYRSPEIRDGKPQVTPDAIIGGGMKLVIIQTFEIFADIHFKYYNGSDGNWRPGMESGVGLRVRFGG